jgi:hypothetical protein
VFVGVPAFLVILAFIVAAASLLPLQLPPSAASLGVSAAEVKTKRMLHARPRLYLHIGP